MFRETNKMSIKHVILGFLSEQSMTGYDLKKKFADSEILHWSGNSNQVYRTLLELHTESLVTIEVQQQVNKPPRKIYTITEEGRKILHAWVLETPALPQIRSPFLAQLTWGDQVDSQAVAEMLTRYAAELQEHLILLREAAHRERGQNHLQRQIGAHWLAFYQHELDWVGTLLDEMK
jgi:DNA-binding PadR family transcriptional regulator